VWKKIPPKMLLLQVSSMPWWYTHRERSSSYKNNCGGRCWDDGSLSSSSWWLFGFTSVRVLSSCLSICRFFFNLSSLSLMTCLVCFVAPTRKKRQFLWWLKLQKHSATNNPIRLYVYFLQGSRFYIPKTVLKSSQRFFIYFLKSSNFR
jgi:hypothetical protein